MAPDEGSSLPHKTAPPVGGDTTTDSTGITPTTPPSAADYVKRAEAYRDLAAFAYSDKLGHQFLEQWIISADGRGYWSRNCPISIKDGPDWANCTGWGPGFYVSELGLPGFGPLSGMSSYVYNDASDAEHPQWVAQTVYNEAGDTRMGRVCPIEDTHVLWSGCSGWSKLETQSTAFNISMAQTFRDEEMLTFKDENGNDVFQHTLLSIDGSLQWSRACPSAGGEPWVGVRTCSFAADQPVADFGVTPGVIAGSASYTYTNVTGLVYAQTVLSVDGTRAERRQCPMTTRGVDWGNCGSFVPVRMDNLREYMGPL